MGFLETCCCCLPSETYGRNGATPIFRSFFTELPVPPQAAGVVGTFNVLDIYPSEHYGLSFGDIDSGNVYPCTTLIVWMLY